MLHCLSGGGGGGGSEAVEARYLTMVVGSNELSKSNLVVGRLANCRLEDNPQKRNLVVSGFSDILSG